METTELFYSFAVTTEAFLVPQALIEILILYGLNGDLLQVKLMKIPELGSIDIASISILNYLSPTFLINCKLFVLPFH